MLATAPGLVRLRELCTVLDTEERALHAFFLKSPDLLAVIDASGLVVKLNPSWQKLLGWGRELTRTPLASLVHEDDRPDFWDRLSALTEESPKPLTCRVRHKDGSYRQVEFLANSWCEDRFNLIGRLVLSNARNHTQTGS